MLGEMQRLTYVGVEIRGRREGNVSSEEDCKEREFRQSTRQLLAWLSIVLHGDFGVGTLHAPALSREARQRAFV